MADVLRVYFDIVCVTCRAAIRKTIIFFSFIIVRFRVRGKYNERVANVAILVAL